MNIELEVIAFIASTLGVGGSIPQIYKIIRTKETLAISYGKYIMLTFASLLWVYYGSLAHVYSIVVWNSLSFCMAITVLMLKFSVEKKDKHISAMHDFISEKSNLKIITPKKLHLDNQTDEMKSSFYKT